MADANAAVAKGPVRLIGRTMNMADYVFGRFGAIVPTGTELDEVLTPDYLANYVHLLKPMAQVDLVSDDMALDVSLRVLTVTKTQVFTRLMRQHADAEKEEEEAGDVPSGFDVTFGGPHHRWRFLHNGEVVKHGFGSRAEAVRAAQDYAAGKG
jgi:hypothetical protein